MDRLASVASSEVASLEILVNPTVTDSPCSMMIPSGYKPIVDQSEKSMREGTSVSQTLTCILPHK